MGKGNGFKLSQSEYAKRRGISQPMVAKLIRQGKLDGAYKKVGRKYLINPDKADAVLAMFENPARSKSAPDPVVPMVDDPAPDQSLTGELISFAEAARREKVARAALLELDLKRQRGDLVQKTRVEAAAAKIATIIRTGVEAIPAKVAPTVAGLSAPGEVARLLQREFKTVLSDMAKEIEKIEF
jgi:hypothetical protein